MIQHTEWPYHLNNPTRHSGEELAPDDDVVEEDSHASTREGMANIVRVPKDNNTCTNEAFEDVKYHVVVDIHG
jgi:hypothetical protein